MYKNYFKRIIDIIVSFVALLCIGWFLIIIWIWLTIANKGAGAFFYQQRPGKNAKMFNVIKFKTMTDERDERGNLLPDVKRITKVGKFVRALSIDELPQLLNVLKGDMSLIGPRPLIPIYLKLFDEKQARRMEVRPGITGWAQVHGRNLCKLSKKFEYDVWYVDHCTFGTDLKIIGLTIWNVINRKDVGSGNGDMKDVDDLGFLDKIIELSKQEQNAERNWQ
mgnify:CR=1 FL=1